MVSFRLLVSVLALSFSISAQAEVNWSDIFKPLREDQNVPSDCKIPSVEDFLHNYDTAIFGIKDSTQDGFTHEYPIERYEATQLHRHMKARHKGETDSDALAYLKSQSPLFHKLAEIEAAADFMGFDFKNEGEVLELLALMTLQGPYPPSDYFHTGGLTYRYPNSSSTTGELDVLVAHRSNCDFVIVGEAKLGHALGKAKGQLDRFRAFVNRMADQFSFVPQQAPVPQRYM